MGYTKKPSDIEIKGNLAEIILRDSNQREVARAIIDIDDISKIRMFRFRISSDGYVRTNRNSLFLHRIIMNAPYNKVVDHINGNKCDNRKCNLRICTQTDNNRNRTRLSRNNTSGYTGVNSLENGTFTACIHDKRRKIHLGTFQTMDEAVFARRQAEVKYYKTNKINHY